MLRVTTALAAGFALAATAASAAPFSATISETGEQTKRQEKSLAAKFADSLRLSLSAISGRAGHSSGDQREHTSYSPDQCERSKLSSDDDHEAAEAKDEEPAGPEPRYYGF